MRTVAAWAAIGPSTPESAKSCARSSTASGRNNRKIADSVAKAAFFESVELQIYGFRSQFT